MANDLPLKNYHTSEIQRKKILALRNYSETLPDFEEWAVLEILARYLERGLIPKKLHRVLDDILDVNGIDYTQWHHRTPWVRQQIMRKHKDPDPNTMYFEFYYDLEKIRRDQWNRSLLATKIYPNQHLNMETGTWM